MSRQRHYRTNDSFEPRTLVTQPLNSAVVDETVALAHMYNE
jgi:hypothetical protein